MNEGLLYNLVECGRQTAVSESNQKSIEMIYRYISIITENNDYCNGLRDGLQCAANLINGVEFQFAMPIKPVGIDDIETSRSLEDIL